MTGDRRGRFTRQITPPNMSVHAQLFGGLTSCSAMCATHPTATISVPNILSQRRVHSVCGLVVALEIKVTWRRRSQKGI